MKQNQITDLPKLDIENLENIFNVYQDDNGLYYYNLLQTIEFPQNLPINFFDMYTITYGDTWAGISYKMFDTPNLWWVILLANNIINPIKFPSLGTNIKIPKMQVVKEILSQIRK